MSPRIAPEQPVGSAVPVGSAGPAAAVGGVAELDRVLAVLAAWGDPAADGAAGQGSDVGGADTGVSDAERIDRIAMLERIKAAAAGAQAGEVVRFAASQVEAQLRADVHPRLVGRGIGDQIGLACKISPAAGSARLATARALWFDLPATYAKLRAGEISDWVAALVCRETSHLDGGTRRRVDAELATCELASLSPRRAATAARRLAYRADPVAAVARARTEEKQRRVTVRPAPDTMAILTAYLPAGQGIAAWAALRRAADTCVASGDARSRGQLMADTLVERLTGHTRATDLNIDIGLVMPVDSLVDPDSSHPVDVHGYGPVPAPVARELLASTAGRVFWRRLFTNPSGHLVGADRRRRRFGGVLAALVQYRDQTCRDPYCDAPIRHLDHIQRFTDGGTTTLPNSRGVCARGNYVREMPGWHVHTLHNGLTDQPHTIQITTPTGHHYTSQAPQPP